MHLVNFQSGVGIRLGAIEQERVYDLQALANPNEQDWFRTTITFIDGGPSAMTAAKRILRIAREREEGFAIDDVALVSPITPSTILCSGSNYLAHNREKANAPLSGKEPEFFLKTADCVIGPDQPILFDPRLTSKLDCETELAIVIGKPGRHIPKERALDHVFGYTIVNDVTARDRQVRRAANGLTWYDLGRGKAFDTSAPMGPVIVTSDEIGDPQNLGLRTRINGELRQSASTSDMIWSCADLIHFFSINFTLRPGMVIITGTPAGTAWSSDGELGGSWQGSPGLVAASRYCLPGDVIESEIERIGILRNTVRALR